MIDNPKGVMPALVTPFTESDEVDVEASRWLVNKAIENGVHAVICTGSLGEFPSLTDDERRIVQRTIVDEANGKVPVIAGVGSGSTKISIEIAKEAADIGVDAIEALPPYYFNIGDEAVYKHYEKLASSVNVPVFIYNFPGTTKVSMSPALVARLAEIPNIVGIKNSVDSLIHLRSIIISTREISKRKPFAVLCGIEDYLIPGILLGAKGTVSGFSNFIPSVLVKIYDNCVHGKVTEAADLYNDIVAPLKELAPPPEPVGALKTGASLFGPVKTSIRLPLLDPPRDTAMKMKAILQRVGLLK
jgi:4-hydroxy-tetrahydrodipicolinate synthase